MTSEEDAPLLQPLSDHDDESASLTSTDPDIAFGGPEARKRLENRLLRKLDRRMSILVLIYILNYIDRNNAAAARLRGFEKDLNLEGSQFASILSVLYVGYLIMQIPSNMFLAYIGKPSMYLPLCMVIWGAISVSTGACPRSVFVGAVATRFFLGFVEAAFFPGALFLISRWYKRTELSQRIALLSCGSLISNAFGSLIASAILDAMEGAWGYAAWRWLFFVEGGLTILVAVIAIFILPDFPHTSSGWLTISEQALAIRRIQEDTGFYDKDTSVSQQISGLAIAVSDGKVWWLALTLTSLVCSLSYNAYFPTLMATMGYSTKITLLLCAPPWAFATLVALFLSRHSDRRGERFKHITASFLLGILGFVMAMSTMNVAVRYVSLFLQAQSYAGFICFLAWASGSISQPPAKRAVGLALINTVSSLGNVFGSYVFPLSWGPTYSKSFAVCIVASVLGLCMCWVFRQHLVLLNEREIERELRAGAAKGYRYTL
ncbi:MFS general substrate transporter [Mucidula mucida]|nr:MFS general substrate transporter [Mucidula mucida]